MADGFGGGGDTIMLFTPHARVYLLIELTALSGEKSKERTIFLPKTPPLWKVILLLHSKS